MFVVDWNCLDSCEVSSITLNTDTIFCSFSFLVKYNILLLASIISHSVQVSNSCVFALSRHVSCKCITHLLSEARRSKWLQFFNIYFKGSYGWCKEVTCCLKQFTLCQSGLPLVFLEHFSSIAWPVFSRKLFLYRIIAINQFNCKKTVIRKYTIHNNLFRFISF